MIRLKSLLTEGDPIWLMVHKDAAPIAGKKKLVSSKKALIPPSDPNPHPNPNPTTNLQPVFYCPRCYRTLPELTKCPFCASGQDYPNATDSLYPKLQRNGYTP